MQKGAGGDAQPSCRSAVLTDMPARASALLLPAAVAALALGLPAAPAVASTCQPRHDQRVIARSARAVLLSRAQPEWGYRLWGCSRRTGARRLLAAGGEDRELRTPMLRGTHVGYVDAGLEGDYATVASDDAVHRGRYVDVAAVFAEDRVDLRMGDDGALAWRDTIPPGQRLRLWRPGDTVRLVDEGFSLTGARFSGRALSWRHDGAERALPPPPASVCPGPAGAGSTTALDIIHTDTATIACWRATGATATFSVTPRALATAGSWVAAATDDSIEVRNPLGSAAARSVPSHGSVAGLVVDEHGSLAWTFGPAVSGHPPAYLTRTAAAWVNDAGGTHTVGTRSIWDTVTLARDGSELRWLINASDGATSGATTLVPRQGA
jgi:hypothetical protein